MDKLPSQEPVKLDQVGEVVLRTRPGTFLHQLICFTMQAYDIPTPQEAIKFALTRVMIIRKESALDE